jgi:hypothetical protein
MDVTTSREIVLAADRRGKPRLIDFRIEEVTIPTRCAGDIRTGENPMNEALTFNADGAKRYADIHWPDGFHPEHADLFAHNEIVVKASCKTVWDHIIEAEKWPSWYSNSHNVKLLNSTDGKLYEDTRFSSDTFGNHVESRIHEFVSSSRIGWFGDGKGINAYHTFLLLKVDEGC